MRSYRQYCPIARASQVLAERWTPIVIRNLLNGAQTFTELCDGAPGMSRSLLTTRLRELQRAGVLEILPHPTGRGHLYRPTAAGRALAPVLMAMGDWAQEWFDLTDEDSDPGFLLHAWISRHLVLGNLPDHRVVVLFDLIDQPPGNRRYWVIFDGPRSEVCLTHPGHEEDLVVRGEAVALAQWHCGDLDWSQALRRGRLQVLGSRDLARELPTWNSRAPWSAVSPSP
ncbi:MAG: helix-turn-helix domain-containing protein [Ornithinimicrobium sp.]